MFELRPENTALEKYRCEANIFLGGEEEVADATSAGDSKTLLMFLSVHLNAKKPAKCTDSVRIESLTGTVYLLDFVRRTSSKTSTSLAKLQVFASHPPLRRLSEARAAVFFD